MNRKSAFFLIILSIFFGISAENYITNVETEPEHGNMNTNGSMKIFYDLPKPNLVEKAYLQTDIDGTTTTFDDTVKESGFLTIDNSMTLSGKKLYDLIKNQRGFDNDEDKSMADGTYNVRVRVELDSTAENDDDETNDEDNDDSESSSVPEYAERTVKITLDNKPPKEPAAIEVEGGNQKLLIRVTPPLAENGKDKEKIGSYHAKISGIFKSDDTETQTVLEFDSEVDSNKYDKEWEFSVSGKSGYEFINNDNNDDDKFYDIEVYAVDLAGNSDSSKTITVRASAVTTYGFWANYTSQGGKDDGGFCFVATAGFGSYFHPSVALLRNFRDSVLAKFDLGRKFINAYYQYGRYPAQIISGSSFLRASSRTLLMPLVISAWFLTTAFGRFLLVLWAFSAIFFLLKGKARLFVLALFALLLVPTQNLEAAIHGEASFTNLLYYPENIDSSSNGKPFKENFGTQIRYLPSLTFGLTIPTKYIRISFIGGIGYTRFKGRAIKTDGSKSDDKTKMHMIPLKAELKLRPVYNFPLYPFIAGGIDYYTWWTRDKNKTSENGGTFGLHGTVGLMFSLNWLDPSSSKKMRETGVVNSSLFLGYRFEKINDFWKDKSFDLSNKKLYNFEFGIVFEF